ncbi:MAG: phosphotransferase family protein [Myxococcota bacterium]
MVPSRAMPSPHGRDPGKTRERLLAWVTTRLPHARDIQMSKLSAPGPTGFSSDTLLFDLSWREGEDRWQQQLVARIEPSGFRVFPHYDVGRQFRVQRQLWKSEVPVARMVWREDDPEIVGAPFYVMEQVSGRIPSDNPPYHLGGWMTEASPEEREAIWWSGLEALAAIHRLDWQERRLGILGREDPKLSSLEGQLEDYRRYLAWASQGRPQPTCEAALDWLVRQRPKEPEPLRLCWGDARIGNMVFRQGRCVAVLDWEMATLGNPVQDLAWWIFMDHHHSAGCDAPRLEGMPDREATLARWAELTGLPPRHVEYYEVFAAFRFSVIMIRIAQQLVFYELLPEDSSFESDNTATRLLASMLGLSAPGAAHPSTRANPP